MATWRIPESACLALTLSDATVVANPTAPRGTTALRVIGPSPIGTCCMRRLVMNGVNTIDLWRGLGAQQRFLAQARRGQNGSVQHLFESVQASVNVYETRSGTEHFPFLLRAGQASRSR